MTSVLIPDLICSVKCRKWTTLTNMDACNSTLSLDFEGHCLPRSGTHCSACLVLVSGLLGCLQQRTVVHMCGDGIVLRVCSEANSVESQERTQCHLMKHVSGFFLADRI